MCYLAFCMLSNFALCTLDSICEANTINIDLYNVIWTDSVHLADVNIEYELYNSEMIECQHNSLSYATNLQDNKKFLINGTDPMYGLAAQNNDLKTNVDCNTFVGSEEERCANTFYELLPSQPTDYALDNYNQEFVLPTNIHQSWNDTDTSNDLNGLLNMYTPLTIDENQNLELQYDGDIQNNNANANTNKVYESCLTVDTSNLTTNQSNYKEGNFAEHNNTIAFSLVNVEGLHNTDSIFYIFPLQNSCEPRKQYNTMFQFFKFGTKNYSRSIKVSERIPAEYIENEKWYLPIRDTFINFCNIKQSNVSAYNWHEDIKTIEEIKIKFYEHKKSNEWIIKKVCRLRKIDKTGTHGRHYIISKYRLYKNCRHRIYIFATYKIEDYKKKFVGLNKNDKISKCINDALDLLGECLMHLISCFPYIGYNDHTSKPYVDIIEIDLKYLMNEFEKSVDLVKIVEILRKYMNKIKLNRANLKTRMLVALTDRLFDAKFLYLLLQHCEIMRE